MKAVKYQSPGARPCGALGNCMPFSEGKFQVRLHGGLDEVYGSGEQGPGPQMEGLRDEKLSLQWKFVLNIFFGIVAKPEKIST